MEGFSLGPLTFHWSGILLALGVAAGFFLTVWEARRRNVDVEIIGDLFWPLVFWGTFGARLWHILTPPLSSVELGLTTRYYFTHPLDMLSLWNGGYGIPGAWVAGMLVLWIYARRYRLPYWRLADLFAPGLALAQSIGRLGNLFSQELYGLPSSAPWSIFIQPAHRLAGYEMVETYHPLFLYESALTLATLFFLLWISQRFADRLKAGDLILAYLACYSLVRISLEFLRIDVALLGGVNINQVFFAVTLVGACIALVTHYRSAEKL